MCSTVKSRAIIATCIAALACSFPLWLSELAGGWTVAKRSGYNPTTSMPSLAEKIALVTGASSGIGRATALHLARKGAMVLVHARKIEKAAPVVAEIRAFGGRAKPVSSDLASLDTVPPMAEEIARLLGKGRALDIAVLNAGLCKNCMGQTDEGFEMTRDGFELHIQVNHLAHQLLVEKLIAGDMLGHSSRLVTVSSFLHALSYPEGVMYDFWKRKGNYTDGKAYSQSKLANIMMASEVHRRFGIESVSVHPGISGTELSRYANQNDTNALRMLFKNVFSLAEMTAEQASYTALWAATAPNISSGFFYPVGVPHAVHKNSDPESCAKLWENSHEHLKPYLGS